jgi:hypothetical protein
MSRRPTRQNAIHFVRGSFAALYGVNMVTFISKVEDVFEISGRGCVVVPGVPVAFSGAALKIGDRITLKRPNGSEIETILRGFEMGSRHPSRCIPILLGKDVNKQIVPIGTELWTVA